MTLLQYLLIKLSEESTEISKVALKSVQFGLDDHHPQKAITNRQDICNELDDMQAAIEMLNEAGLGYTPNRENIERKKEKVIKFLTYSVHCGTVDTSALLKYIKEDNV